MTQKFTAEVAASWDDQVPKIPPDVRSYSRDGVKMYAGAQRFKNQSCVFAMSGERRGSDALAATSET